MRAKEFLSEIGVRPITPILPIPRDKPQQRPGQNFKDVLNKQTNQPLREQNQNEVKTLQQYLIQKGAKITADGVLGPRTKAAIQQFLKGDEYFLQTGSGEVALSTDGMPVRVGSEELPVKPVTPAIARPSVSISSEEDIMNMIKRHEGVKDKPYKDTKGLWTVGIGHLIGDGRTLPPEFDRTFSPEEINDMFMKDYNSHKEAAQRIPGYNNLNTNGRAALIDLTFNMGKNWFRNFPNFTKALASGDITRAAQELKNSNWYRQVGNRAPTIVSLLQSGAATA